jgi:cytochrome c peroxidase
MIHISLHGIVKKSTNFLSFILFSIILMSCNDVSEPITDSFPGFYTPANFPQPTYAFSSNPVTKDGFALGKKLFYDGILSRTGLISCGTCHLQNSSFSQMGHAKSHGVDDGETEYNAPPVINLAWNQAFMWEGGVLQLDDFPVNPITSHIEMDETLANVVKKLAAHPQYPSLFKAAFGTDEITAERMIKALSQFQVMCISADSKYDKVKRSEGAQFTSDEQAGYTLFKAHCASCHTEPLFTDSKFHNNGIVIMDPKEVGRQNITLNPNDAYKFKTQTLRNAIWTSPYMHDGRFETLDQVINHYSDGIIDHATVDTSLNNPMKRGLQFSDIQKKQLLSFLKTLSDTSFIQRRLLSEF